MAKMITRTFRTQEVTVMTMDVTTNATEPKTLTLLHVLPDNDKILKAAKKLDTDTLKVVYVVGSEVKEQLRGVDEEQFIAISVPLNK